MKGYGNYGPKDYSASSYAGYISVAGNKTTLTYVYVVKIAEGEGKHHGLQYARKKPTY